MEQHPIPQDVTGFQFKLIGSMTVKQFGYVASGVILAVILYYLPLGSAFGILTKLLFVPLFGTSGVIVAFIPVDGRPIDVMATNFVKALFSPNQYIYHREGRQLSFEHISIAKAPTQQQTQQKMQTQAHPTVPASQLDQKEEKLRTLLLSSRGRMENAIDKKEAAFLTALTIPDQAQPVTIAMPVIKSSPPSPQIQLTAIQHTPVSTTRPKEYSQVAQQQISTPVAKTPEAHPHTPQSKPLQPLQDPTHVRTIPQGVSKKAGLPHVSDSPNVVVGIVKDPRGNILSNILVEVKDKDGNPVRAFKTNQLGQFASATPLSPGTYTIELEDPKQQHRFDVIQIIAENKVLLPIEVISHDAREELRRQLFAN